MPPNWGGPRYHRGPKFSLDPLNKVSTPNFKYKTLEISEAFVIPYSVLSCDLFTQQ